METINLNKPKSTKLLWLSPNLNHYKARLINRLHNSTSVDVTVVAGAGRQNSGDKSLFRNWDFTTIQVSASKTTFGLSLSVMKLVFQKRNQFDWMLVPKEFKYTFLIFYCWLLKNIFTGNRLKIVTYNHPIYLSGPRKTKQVKRFFTRLLYSLYDSIVFYTETARNSMVEAGFVNPEKAHFANNTVDTDEIRSQYDFEIPDAKPTILFIGRLIPSKKLSVCIEYFQKLRQEIPELKLVVIGDGPDAHLVRDLSETDKNVTWTGALVEEAEIAQYMKKSSLVFIPGASGLSVNHAFAYGRPYATCKNALHGPELSYIEDDRNGLLLEGEESSDIPRLSQFLNSSSTTIFNEAWETGSNLSVSQWCNQFQQALNVSSDTD